MLGSYALLNVYSSAVAVRGYVAGHEPDRREYEILYELKGVVLPQLLDGYLSLSTRIELESMRDESKTEAEKSKVNWWSWWPWPADSIYSRYQLPVLYIHLDQLAARLATVYNYFYL